MDHEEFPDDPESADRRLRESEREIEELGLTPAEFDNLERDFQSVLHELSGDKTLERFRIEYEKLNKALKTSHETEKRLIKRCKELNSDISANMSRVQVAIKLSQEDALAITQIQQDVKRTWKAVDESREKEEELKKRGTELKQEFAELTRRIENDETTPVAQHELLVKLAKEKEQIEEMRHNELDKLKTLKDKNNELQRRVTGFEEAKQALEFDIKNLKDGILKANQDAKDQEVRKQNTEKDLDGIKQNYESIQQNIKTKQAEKDALQATINEYLEHIQHQRDEIKSITSKIQDSMDYNHKLDEGLQQLSETQKRLLEEEDRKKAEMRRMQEEESNVQMQYQRAQKEIMVMTKKIKQATQDRQQLDADKDFSKQTLQNLMQSNTDLRRENERDRKAISSLMKEIQRQNKECINLDNNSKSLKDEIIMKMNELKKINNEVKGSKNESGKIQVLINQLEFSREKYALEASNAYSKYFQSLERVKYKNSMIAECQKENVEAMNKLKQQQNLYEAVRSDRNIYSKALLESNEEIDDLRRKYKILHHSITKLREEIGVKNNQIREQRTIRQNLEDDNASNRNKKQNMENRKKNFEAQIKKYDEQINRLKNYIGEAEQESIKQKKEYEMVINDRDILGTQLIKRNEELASLYEKIKIQQSTLAKGEVQYQKKLLKTIRTKNQIIDLKRELLVAKNQVSCLPDLKREVHQLTRELMEAKTKVKALSEELNNPMNVHRYRKLEGTNPETYEMILKIQTLQRRLIAKTQEVAEKDFLIQEKERLYIELKNILARQPGSEVEEQLSVYHHSVKEKSRQMNKMLTELDSYHAQVNQYRFEIERLSKELQGLKNNWFEQKRQGAKKGVEISQGDS